VELILAEDINSSNASEGQSLRFTVASPVRYSGHIIVEKGAVATGRIRSIVDNKISVSFYSVTARNGQQLFFQENEASNRSGESRGRNYTAMLKKGFTIRF
jgi:hypothetical protein